MLPERRRFESIGPPPVTWGVTLCYSRACVAPAVLTIDGWPYCLTCGDDQVERAVAAEIAPELVSSSFPTVDDR